MTRIDYFNKHNLTVSNLQAVDKQSVNLVYLTDHFVLRMARPELAGTTDHEREAELGLKAFELDLKTAKPVAWGKTYSIWERLPGQALQDSETCPPQIWHELLDTLEHLHHNPPEPRIPVKAWTGNPELIQKTQALACWTPTEQDQLHTLLSEPQPITSPLFIHGDAYADNILVDEGKFVGLIDWGNAGWQCLEQECSSLDESALELALQRWRDKLDLELLWKMRLNLLLEVLSYGRVDVSEVRAVLSHLIDSR